MGNRGRQGSIQRRLSISARAPRTFRAGSSAYVGLAIVDTVVLAMGMVAAVKDPRPATMLLVCLLLLLAGLTVAWLRAFRIEVTPSSLIYRTLLHARKVALSDIVAVRLSMEPLKEARGPTVRLELTLTGDQPPLVMNAKVFSREAVRTVRSLAPAADGSGPFDALLPRD
jgi:hypothetical protein